MSHGQTSDEGVHEWPQVSRYLSKGGDPSDVGAIVIGEGVGGAYEPVEVSRLGVE